MGTTAGPGAFAEGWIAREGYKNARATGTWQYVSPGGHKFRTIGEARTAAGRPADHEGGGGGRGFGRGRGRGRGRGSSPSAVLPARASGPGQGGPLPDGSFPLVRLVMSRGGRGRA